MLVIDGKSLIAKEGDTILAVAKRAGIHIPTLCHQEWAEPQGGCRLCCVEITKKSWDGWCKVVTACNHPAQDGLIVYTHSERIITIRKNIVDLLLARCPESEVIQDLAKEYGILETTYKRRENPDNCILCGLCVQACEAMGVNAISMTDRGINKRVTTPYDKPNNVCVGCASCAKVCPTNNIPFTESNKTRKIWDQEFPMLRCTVCGRAHITQAQMEKLVADNVLPRDYFDKCEICHQKETVETFKKISF
ncbi:MAG TPA: 2Fe-2S iron-sulfur cluster-binding protein [Planctomycetota bacterium]|nr:2Fe-2S iron-sulfur cluster-binding protein [Planctomycetota bacterium]HQB01041.1 2Fe-2S iron-sulfur cluster-binding protein [Planctomycetota bacterium]